MCHFFLEKLLLCDTGKVVVLIILPLPITFVGNVVVINSAGLVVILPAVYNYNCRLVKESFQNGGTIN